VSGCTAVWSRRFTYGAAGVPPPLFTGAITPQITPIRAVHIQELRQAVVSLEGG